MLVISKAEGARLYVFLNKLTNSFKSFFFASPSTWPGVGKNLLNHKIVFDDSRFPFEVGKPIKNTVALKDVLLNPKAEFIIDRFTIEQDLHDILLRRGLANKFSAKETHKKLIHKQQGIQNTISASIKGNLFIRDEEYVTGTYFLEPYVATIPPGRSRQF